MTRVLFQEPPPAKGCPLLFGGWLAGFAVTRLLLRRRRLRLSRHS